MKKILLLLILVLLPSVARPQDEGFTNRSHWALELKGGMFDAALENWPQYYEKKRMPEYAGSLAYLFSRYFEAGIGAGRMKADGKGLALFQGTPAGSVTYVYYPVNVFVLARGALHEDQWLVPYIGGGWTRMYYRQDIKDGMTTRGATDGYHLRGGLEFSLDALDPDASRGMYRDYSVRETYLFLEAEYTHAAVQSGAINLGGTAYLAGLRFEF